MQHYVSKMDLGIVNVDVCHYFISMGYKSHLRMMTIASRTTTTTTRVAAAAAAVAQ